jgi:hypothetical protein
MVDLGILVPRDVQRPFLPSDVQKVRLARACEAAGLPMDGIGRAIQTQGLRQAGKGVRSPRHLNGCLDPLADGSIPESAYAGSIGIDCSRRGFGPLLSGPEEPPALLVAR